MFIGGIPPAQARHNMCRAMLRPWAISDAEAKLAHSMGNPGKYDPRPDGKPWSSLPRFPTLGLLSLQSSLRVMAKRTGVFISWSGPLAESVALVLRKWVTVLVSNVQPFMSKKDIGAGARGLDEIAQTLDRVSFGIIVLTKSNQHAPWLNFEAGALSKRLGGSEALVAPLLVDLRSMAQVTGPLAQFQGNPMDRQGLTEIFKSLSTAAKDDWPNVLERLDGAWTKIEQELTIAITNAAETDSDSFPDRTDLELLEEVLNRVRVLPDQIRSLTFNSARASRNEMEKILLHVRTWTTVPAQTVEDDQYMAAFAASPEYHDALVDAYDLFSQSESYSLWYEVKKMQTIAEAWRAVQTGKLTGTDLSQLAIAYQFSHEPMSTETIHRLLLRQLVVLKEIGEITHSPRG